MKEGLIKRAEHKIKEVLKEERYVHSINTAKMAVDLAKIYNVSENVAYIAGLLHDYAKEHNGKELLHFADIYGVEIDEYQAKQPKILHGPIGAEMVKEEFKIFDEDILNSIRYHTTGRKNMSMLEKIIYLSDYLEEGRDHGYHLIHLRKLVFNDINKTLLIVIDKTLKYLIDNNKIIQRNSIEARNYLIIN